MIFAFSFAASRAPEWSGATSSTTRSYAALTFSGMSSAFAYSRPLNWILVLGFALTKRPELSPIFTKFKCAVFGVNVNGLAFADFAFKNIDAERIENFSLNGATQGSCAVNGIVAFA